jgi:hypothetical protein
VADPNVLPLFFSTMDSMFFYNDKEVVKELKEMVLWEIFSTLVA